MIRIKYVGSVRDSFFGGFVHIWLMKQF